MHVLFSHMNQNGIVQVFSENASEDTVFANRAGLFIRVPGPRSKRAHAEHCRR